MMLTRNLIAFTVALTLPGVGGCYGYYPTRLSDLTGRDVQISLTDSGAVVLTPRLGAVIESVDGKVVSVSPSGFLLSVTGTQRRDGVENLWKGEGIEIPRTLVSTIMEKHFSRARTILFVAAATVVTVATKRAFGGAGGANAPGGTQPPPVTK